MQHRTSTALLIPARLSEPLEVVQVSDDLASIREHVFRESPGRSELAFSSFQMHRAQLAYDDLGLWRVPQPERNIRAMMLWAHMVQAESLYDANPLVGTFLLMGLSPADGDTTDMPEHLAQWMLSQDYARRGTPPEQQLCPAQHPGGPFISTHHFRPVGLELRCEYCDESMAQLRGEEEDE